MKHIIILSDNRYEADYELHKINSLEIQKYFKFRNKAFLKIIETAGSHQLSCRESAAISGYEIWKYFLMECKGECDKCAIAFNFGDYRVEEIK